MTATQPQNLAPTNTAVHSPLRELDWTDDDYTMEIVSGRIYDRNVDDIFESLSLLNDRGGDTTYFPSMAEHGEHVIKASIPPTILHMVEQVGKEYHNLEISDAVRICALHGCAIYEHKFGAEIEALYHKNFKKQLDGDVESVRIHLLSMNIRFQAIRYGCRIEGRFYQLLSRFSAHAGCQKQYMFGLWILYSIRTHPRMKPWYTQIDAIIEDIESVLSTRIKLLQ